MAAMRSGLLYAGMGAVFLGIIILGFFTKNNRALLGFIPDMLLISAHSTALAIPKTDRDGARMVFMCGRHMVFTEQEEIEMREILDEINRNFTSQAQYMKTGEIFPTNLAPVIIPGRGL